MNSKMRGDERNGIANFIGSALFPNNQFCSIVRFVLIMELFLEFPSFPVPIPSCPIPVPHLCPFSSQSRIPAFQMTAGLPVISRGYPEENSAGNPAKIRSVGRIVRRTSGELPADPTGRQGFGTDWYRDGDQLGIPVLADIPTGKKVREGERSSL